MSNKTKEQSKMPELNFIVNKEYIIEKLGETVFNRIKGKSLIQFQILLPFFMPTFKVPLHYKNTENLEMIFVFEDVTVENKFSRSIIGDDLKQKSSTDLSLVELVCVSEETIDNCLKDNHNYVFQLIKEFNAFVFSYKMKNNALNVKRINSSNLINNLSLLKISEIGKPKNFKDCLIMHNELLSPLKTNKNPVPKEVQVFWLQYSQSIVSGFKPLILSEERAFKAIQYFFDMNLTDSIINCQISVELLLSEAYRQLLMIEGIEDKEATKMVINVKYESLIKKFTDRLGGDWDRTKVSASFGKYWNNTYLLRNKIIHLGISPNYQEAKEALEATLNFRDYFFSLIKSKKKKYSEMNEYLTIVYNKNLETQSNRAYKSLAIRRTESLAKNQVENEIKYNNTYY